VPSPAGAEETVLQQQQQQQQGLPCVHLCSCCMLRAAQTSWQAHINIHIAGVSTEMGFFNT